MSRKNSDLQLVDEADPTCRICGSTDVTKASTHLDMKNSLVSKRYTCKKCGATFTAGKGRHMKTPDYIVRFAVVMMKNVNGWMTCGDVAKLTEEVFGIRVTARQIGIWLHKAVPGIRLHQGRIKAPGPKKKHYAYKASRVLVSARALRSMKVRLDQMAGELAELEKKAKENGKA